MEVWIRSSKNSTGGTIAFRDVQTLGRNRYSDNDPHFQRMKILSINICRFAFDKIKEEMPYLKDVKLGDSCNCSIRINYKLPCRHTIPNDNSTLELSLLDPRWLLYPENQESVTQESSNHNHRQQRRFHFCQSFCKSKQRICLFHRYTDIIPTLLITFDPTPPVDSDPTSPADFDSTPLVTSPAIIDSTPPTTFDPTPSTSADPTSPANADTAPPTKTDPTPSTNADPTPTVNADPT
ncbi:hypothetical protein, partial, partial [Absidia glauca]